jgi:DNA-binding NarL/FixJ family response regulator
MPAFSGCVLIVDDNALIRAALRVLLEENLGLVVCGEAADGSQAIEKARTLHPSLILMDVSMPGTNGVEAAWTIRKTMPGSRVILFTLYKDVIGKTLANACGVDLVLAKDEGAEGLTQMLRRYFDGDGGSPLAQ